MRLNSSVERGGIVGGGVCVCVNGGGGGGGRGWCKPKTFHVRDMSIFFLEQSTC